jgi:hypothetical protein
MSTTIPPSEGFVPSTKKTCPRFCGAAESTKRTGTCRERCSLTLGRQAFAAVSSPDAILVEWKTLISSLNAKANSLLSNNVNRINENCYEELPGLDTELS